MKLILLITIIESALIAVLMILWRFRNTKNILVPLRSTASTKGGNPETERSEAQTARWGFINEWKVEAQADDRMQALGDVRPSFETASGRRSTGRRRHQAMHKQWSKDRHD